MHSKTPRQLKATLIIIEEGTDNAKLGAFSRDIKAVEKIRRVTRPNGFFQLVYGIWN